MAAAFLLVAFSVHLPAARDPGPDPLERARRPFAAVAVAAVAVAAAAGAVVAEAADHKRPAFFLFGRVLHPFALHQAGARLAHAIREADLREVRRAHLRP